MKYLSDIKSSLLVSRNLTADGKLNVFAKNSLEQSENEVTLSYLKQCEKVRVFTCKRHKDGNNNWVAGYAINIRRPFRYLEDYDHQEIEKILNQSGIQSEKEICEITCIWILKRQKKFKLTEPEKIFVYVLSLYDSFWTSKKYVIGGAVVHSIWKQFKRVLTRQLYLGHVKLAKKQTNKAEQQNNSNSEKKINNNESPQLLGLVLFQKGRFWLLLYLIRAIILEMFKGIYHYPWFIKWFTKEVE